MSLYALKQAQTPTVLTVTLPGGRNLHKSLKNYGDLHVAVDTSLPTEQDSEELQYFYIPNLTVDAGKTLTASNRCAGMVIYTDNLVLNGKITMKGKGGKCRKSLHALTDLTIPDEVKYEIAVPTASALAKDIREGAITLDKALKALNLAMTTTPGTKVLVPALGGKGGRGHLSQLRCSPRRSWKCWLYCWSWGHRRRRCWRCLGYQRKWMANFQRRDPWNSQRRWSWRRGMRNE